MNEPLKNKVFISTRPQGQSDELARLFAGAGGRLIEMPLIQIQPAELSAEEKKWLSELEKFQWLVFTSPNGVRYFFETLGSQKLPQSLQIGVVGNKTEKVLNQFGYHADFVNPGNTGEDFAEAFLREIKDEKKKPSVLLSLGNLARNVIEDKLKNYASCFRINIYETVSPENADENVLEMIKNDQYEMVIFTSPSGIENFLSLKNNIKKNRLRIASIGKTTAKSATENGIEPVVVAEEPSAKGLVQSIIKYYEQK